MKPHDPTSTPITSGRHPEAVRLARSQSSNLFSFLLFLGRFHVVMGFVRASRATARIKRLPPIAWLLEPYMQWEREKIQMEWQALLDISRELI